MPRQASGLKFHDRVARTDDGFVFRCQRVGHGEIVVQAALKRDIEQARTEHDASYHSSLGRRLNASGANLRLGDGCRDFLRYVGELEKAGKRDPKTTEFYGATCARLVEGFGATSLIAGITVSDCRAYVLYRTRTGGSRGARVVQELKVLEKIAKDRGVQLSWRAKQFVDEVRPEKRSKRLLAKDQLVAFIQHLDKDAQDFAIAKLRTVMRNEELYDLRVANVDLDTGLIRYVARAKRVKKERSQPIASDLRPILVERCAGKLPMAFVFTCRGRKVGQSSFRKACLRASKLAELDPPITGMSSIRHHMLTFLRALVGREGAADLAGHGADVLDRHYDLDLEKLAAKRLAIEAGEDAVRL